MYSPKIAIKQRCFTIKNTIYKHTYKQSCVAPFRYPFEACLPWMLFQGCWNYPHLLQQLIYKVPQVYRPMVNNSLTTSQPRNKSYICFSAWKWYSKISKYQQYNASVRWTANKTALPSLRILLLKSLTTIGKANKGTFPNQKSTTGEFTYQK